MEALPSNFYTMRADYLQHVSFVRQLQPLALTERDVSGNTSVADVACRKEVFSRHQPLPLFVCIAYTRNIVVEQVQLLYYC